MKVHLAFLILALIVFAGCDTASLDEATTGGAAAIDVESSATSNKVEQFADLVAFLPSGDVGGGVLEPGVFFPPTNGRTAKLVRSPRGVQFIVRTTGLPPGAYTVWIGTINNPGACATSPCTEPDIFTNTEAVDASFQWGAGGIVESDGVGEFTGRLPLGYFTSDPDQVALPGNGLQDPWGAEIHLIVKYHGPPSDDPDTLYQQTHTLLGSCFEGANALDLGEPFPGVVFGVQCFDPQATAFTP